MGESQVHRSLHDRTYSQLADKSGKAPDGSTYLGQQRVMI